MHHLLNRTVLLNNFESKETSRTELVLGYVLTSKAMFLVLCTLKAVYASTCLPPLNFIPNFQNFKYTVLFNKRVQRN